MRRLNRSKAGVDVIAAIVGVAIVVIGLTVGFFLLGSLGPSAILQVDNASTTDWNANTITIWNNLSIGYVIAILVAIFAIPIALLVKMSSKGG